MHNRTEYKCISEKRYLPGIRTILFHYASESIIFTYLVEFMVTVNVAETSTPKDTSVPFSTEA